jgi:translation initiation factor 2B subunit (eIF-2B alpha/beta/delta family)
MDTLVTERARMIAEDRTHGAGWLARQAVETLADAVSRGADPLESGATLAAARPAIGAIAGAVGRVLAAGRTPEVLLEECRALVDRRDRAAHSIAVLLKPSVSARVMTHSASSTVQEALLHGEPTRVVCTLAQDFDEGERFAEELRGEGLAVDLVAEADAGHALESVDTLLLGADCVFRDGSFANRVGTSELAATATELGVPVLVACETFKLAPFDALGERDDEWEDEQPFDLTSGEHVDRYFTEEGEFAPDDIAALVDQTPFLQEGWALLRTAGARSR